RQQLRDGSVRADRGDVRALLPQYLGDPHCTLPDQGQQRQSQKANPDRPSTDSHNRVDIASPFAVAKATHHDENRVLRPDSAPAGTLDTTRPDEPFVTTPARAAPRSGGRPLPDAQGGSKLRSATQSRTVTPAEHK